MEMDLCPLIHLHLYTLKNGKEEKILRSLGR